MWFKLSFTWIKCSLYFLILTIVDGNLLPSIMNEVIQFSSMVSSLKILITTMSLVNPLPIHTEL